MSNEKTKPETKGVTVKLLTTVDLGPEIEGMAGRQLRMRMVTIEPGGVIVEKSDILTTLDRFGETMHFRLPKTTLS